MSHAAEVPESGPLTVFTHFGYRIVWHGSTTFEVFYSNTLLMQWTYTPLDETIPDLTYDTAVSRAEDWWALGGSRQASESHREVILAERR